MAVFPNFNLNWLKRAINKPTIASPGDTGNKFYDTFLTQLGFGYTTYDTNKETYLEKGYQINGDVYAIINQIATKCSSIPFAIKTFKEQEKNRQFRYSRKALLGGGPREVLKVRTKAKETYEETMQLPITRPNPLQTWSEWIGLYETYLNVDGNVFIYMASPQEGKNKGKPMHLYILPSHLVQIKLITGAQKLDFDMSPVSHYEVITSSTRYKFYEDEIIHVNYPNPAFDFEGSHLYGQSPLMAVLKEIQASNEGNDNNIRMQRSGGAIGLLYGKNNYEIDVEQANTLKRRLVEMRNDNSQLSQIIPMSMEIGFERIALTNRDLEPYEAQKYAQKKIANALGWSDKLLNNDEGAKYDNVQIAYKAAILNKIMPDLKMLEDALTEKWLPRFEGAYKSSQFCFLFEELPEMDQNLMEISQWITPLLDRGVVNREETRALFNMEPTDDPDMATHTVGMGVIPLSESIAAINLDDEFPEEEPEEEDQEPAQEPEDDQDDERE